MPQRQTGAGIGPDTVAVWATVVKAFSHAFGTRQKVRLRRAPGKVNETGKTAHTAFS
jgi:hypothetical protein